MADVRWEKTGEYRCPLAGEWFADYGNHPIQARFDFQATKHEIMRPVVTLDPIHVRPPNQFPHDTPPGYVPERTEP